MYLATARIMHLYDFALKFLAPETHPVDIRFINYIQTAVNCYGIYPIKAYTITHKSTMDGSEVDWKPLFDNKAKICFERKKPKDFERYQSIRIQNELFNKK